MDTEVLDAQSELIELLQENGWDIREVKATDYGEYGPSRHVATINLKVRLVLDDEDDSNPYRVK